MPLPRSPERMAHQHSAGLGLSRQFTWPPQHRPVVALTRLPGAHGEELARLIAARLGYELYDQELIHAIATSSHHSDRVVESLDERARGLLTQWLTEAFSVEPFTPHDYRDHLGRVVGALVHRGGAVIVGRGAHLMVPPGLGIRVLALAPYVDRVRTVAVERGCCEAAARGIVEHEESARRRFLREHFHAELADPTAVDLVVNTSVLGISRAAGLVVAAVHEERPGSLRTA